MPWAWTALLLLCIQTSSFSQDAIFSQYYASSLYLNPALAGIEPSLTFASNYRMQWRSVTDPYTTSQFSLIKPLYIQREGQTHAGGIGISFYNDRSGRSDFMTNGVNINGAYNVYLSEYKTSSLTLGVQVGLIQKRLNFENLEWGSQYNPFIGFDATLDPEHDHISAATLYPDIGAGLLYYYNSGRDYTTHDMSGYLGISAYHLNQPNESLIQGDVSRLPTLYKLHGGIEWHVSERLNVSPNFIIARQGEAMQYNGGFYLNYQFSEGESKIAPTEFILGGWYRLYDSFIAAAGFGNKYYTLAFSYDINNTSLRYNTIGRGAYEVSLRITRPRADISRRFYTPRI